MAASLGHPRDQKSIYYDNPKIMDKKLVKLIDTNSHKFNDWIESINLYNQSYALDREYIQEERLELTDNVANVLGEISEMLFKYGAFKEKFDNSMMSLNLYGLYIIIKSAKTNTTFDFGIDNNGIYLHTNLEHSNNLCYMDDAFYKDIYLLDSLGKFEIVENESYSSEAKSKYPEFFGNRKSTIFRLLRNYFVGTAEKERNILLGDFQISWSYGTDFIDIISNACLAFKTLYKLNYALWKVSDLQLKKNYNQSPTANFQQNRVSVLH